MRPMLLGRDRRCVASLIVVPVADAWTWPAEGPVLRPFALGPRTQYAAGQHRGVDIGADVGGQVLAPVAGTVSFAGSIPAGGRALTIQTADGYAVTLLQLGSIDRRARRRRRRRSPVGAVGESADAVTSAPHVHLGVRVASEPNGYVDPLGSCHHLRRRGRVPPSLRPWPSRCPNLCRQPHPCQSRQAHPCLQPRSSRRRRPRLRRFPRHGPSACQSKLHQPVPSSCPLRPSRLGEDQHRASRTFARRRRVRSSRGWRRRR